MAILEVLERGGVSPEAYVWVHSQNDKDAARRASATQRGAWASLDGISPESLEAHVEAVLDLAGHGRLGRVLVSQDAGWYHVGEPGGGRYRPHTTLFDAFLPALRARGLGDAEIRALLVENPARAFAVRRRPGQPERRPKIGFNAP
jgi:phosphotriesterase-related protein